MRHCAAYLPFSRVKPAGWIRAYMQRDLDGFIGHLDELVPELICKDQIYGRDRRTHERSDQALGEALGIAAVTDEWVVQYHWWNSETQGNWMDGFVRTVLLLDDPEMRAKAEKYVRYYLSTQDEDGYLGIYQPDLRFHPGTENGELWSIATITRCLLAYYQATGEAAVLTAVTRALACVMDAYPLGSDARPFDTREESPDAHCTGTGHGLMLVDSFYCLYRLTGERRYWDYAVWLYQQFNEEKDASNLAADIMLDHILDPQYGFRDHGVHTYEQARALILAAYGSDDPRYREALKMYLHKVRTRYTCPSGGPISDENLRPEGYDPTVTAYEYCCIHELLHTYSLLLELSGDLQYADDMESLLFNAGMGAHLPQESAITYCKSDNSYSLMGEFQCAQPHSFYGDLVQRRYQYSPTHQDTAMCCVPNAGRIVPYYLRRTYLLEGDVLTKVLYGPSQMTAQVAGAQVTVGEESEYPFNNRIRLTVRVSTDAEFTLRLRVPGWADAATLTGARYTHEDGCLVIRRVWTGETALTLTFFASPVLRTDRLGEAYVTYGALVMALPIESEEHLVRDYPLPGFHDKQYSPAPGAAYDFALCANETLRGDPETAQVKAVFMKDGEKRELTLVPMGKTILRRVTFPKA
ncbi:MAG: glycoside hydrolase family 127 protein [Eubacteriales bacterium]|nr:glycoside hydrolase family 127 protein [Eubacteriales bacterium]